MQTLEEAQAAMLRGDHKDARDIVQTILAKEPENSIARRLLAQIEAIEDVPEAAVVQVNTPTSWLDALDLGTWQIYMLLVAATICLGVGVVLAINPIWMGLHQGFNAQVMTNPNGGFGSGYYPIHFLLIAPTIMVVLGGFMLYTIFRYIRS